MTTADRVNARGRSLPFKWGTLPPNAPSRPFPLPPTRKGGQVLSQPDYDYATYAPPGTKCATCEQPIGKDQVSRRTTTERQSGPPAVVYRHFPEDCAGGES